ncbi:MAG: hypothetical protein BGO34_07205 [Bacteroidia bacterium 44-10]|nr:MAG: hypothetical protein BGO34_07205 [Bacteroidia bacterium 44-10]
MKATTSVQGRIIEESTNLPMEYTNILLLSIPDSAFVTGTTSDENGLFQFNNLNNGKYVLKISYIGFEPKLIPIVISSEPLELGSIKLEESNILSEVIITSKIPPFQSGVNGGIVANVSTTLLSSVGTASDVLQRMPGIVSENGKITVFGKGAPIVYINNRKVQDASELERIESTEISTVELITNPGAKYDAEGRAVLLIKTKSRINGFSGQITERLRIGKYLGDNENISAAYTTGGLNLFATYYHNHSKRESTENHYFILENEEGVWKYNTLLPDYVYSNNSQLISAGFDYSLDDRHSIGGQYQFDTGDYKDTTPIHTTTDLNDDRYETSQAKSFSKNESYQHLVNAFYNGDFSNKFSLRLDFDYLKNHDEAKQQSNETINNEETRIVDIFNQTDYDLYAGKLTNSWKSGAGLVEFGAEYNYISGDGFVRSNGSTDNTEFTNKEQKTSGFASYSHTLGNANVVAGLRYEFTSEQFTEGEEKTEIIDRSYSDWYPNLSVSGMLGDVNLSFAFNKRTRRPSFSQLNGNVVYVNRFVFQRGDPYLKKSNIYDLNLQATLKAFYLSLGYAHTKNPVLSFFREQENNANSILLTYANFPKYQELYTTFNWNTKIAFWQPNYSINVTKPFFSANYDGQMIDYDKFNYTFRAYNDFTLPLGWVLSCNFLHWSDRQDAFFETKGYQRLDLGLRKSVFDNSLRMNLMVYDIFNGVKDENSMRMNNLQWDADKKNETRYATLSVTYMFNNYRKKYRGSSAAQDDINRF